MFEYNIILQESTSVIMSRKRISLFLWQFVKVKSLSFLSVWVFVLHFSLEDICLSVSCHFIASLRKYILVLQMDLPKRCYSKDFFFNGYFPKKNNGFISTMVFLNSYRCRNDNIMYNKLLFWWGVVNCWSYCTERGTPPLTHCESYGLPILPK